jgi:hypothetical protein
MPAAVDHLSDSDEEPKPQPGRTCSSAAPEEPSCASTSPPQRARQTSKVMGQRRVNKRRRDDLPGLLNPVGTSTLAELRGLLPVGLLCLELCCGATAGLTTSLLALGLPAVGLDYKLSLVHDMLNPALQGLILALVVSRSLKYVHLGIPCNTFSMARWPKLRSQTHPRGKPGLSPEDQAEITYANRLTDFLCSVGHCAADAGVGVSIENPHNSMLWSYDQIVDLVGGRTCDMNVFHSCQYGVKWLKPTRVMCFNIALPGLNKLCDGQHQHEKLSGWTQYKGEKRTPTKKATSYPDALCLAWAADVATHVHSSSS